MYTIHQDRNVSLCVNLGLWNSRMYHAVPNLDDPFDQESDDITQITSQVVPENPSSYCKRRCVAPKCTSDDLDDVVFHRFPNDEARLTLWLSKFPIIPWKYCKRARLCSKHFTADSYKHTSCDSNSTRNKPGTAKTLKRPQLANDAVPTIWPNVPTHLLKDDVEPSERPTKLSSALSRRQSTEAIAKENDQLIDKDSLLNAAIRLPPGCVRIVDASSVIYLKAIVDEKPRIQYCVKVSNSLRYEIWLEDRKISLKELLPGATESHTIDSLSVMQQLIDSLEEHPEDNSIEKRIDVIIESIKALFPDNRQILFLCV